MKIQLILVIIALLSLLSSSQGIKNTRPVIGILSQESSFSGYPPEEYQYIAASYVKYIEMAGARVVPLYYDADKEYYDRMFDQINGLLIPGGAAEFTSDTKLGQNGYYLYQKAIEANDNGVYFPIWGTCNGFEMLATFTNDFNKDVLTGIKGENSVTHKISLVQSGTLYTEMPSQLLFDAENEKLYYYNHEWAISIETWQTNDNLRDFYNLLATSTSNYGERFVATFEGIKYPFTGVQFHPEKSPFEWKIDSINHSVQAIENAQYYADYFVQQSRKNAHFFLDEDELNKELIYNFNPIQIPSSSFNQVYIFKNFENEQKEQQQQKTLVDLMKEKLNFSKY